jgi:hypothetical protein
LIFFPFTFPSGSVLLFPIFFLLYIRSQVPGFVIPSKNMRCTRPVTAGLLLVVLSSLANARAIDHRAVASRSELVAKCTDTEAGCREKRAAVVLELGELGGVKSGDGAAVRAAGAESGGAAKAGLRQKRRKEMEEVRMGQEILKIQYSVYLFREAKLTPRQH